MDQILKQYAELERNNWWYKARRDLLARILAQLRMHFNNSLDIGCGTGVNYVVLAQHASNVYGVDIEKNALLCDKNKGYAELIHGNAEDLEIDKKFDLIICMDVLEHLDDKKAINNLKNKLNKDGVLIVSVPAHMYLWGFNDTFAGHKRRYEKEEVEQLLGNFTIKKLSYWNQSMFIPALLFCRLKINKNQQNNLNLVPKGLNRVLYFIMKMENRFFMKFNLLQGVSIVCVAKNS